MTTYSKKRRTILSSFAVFQDSGDEGMGSSRLAQAKAIAHRSRVHSPTSEESPDELSTFVPSQSKAPDPKVIGKSSSATRQHFFKAAPPQLTSRTTNKPLPPPPHVQDPFAKPDDRQLLRPLSQKPNNHRMPRPWERGRSPTKLQISAPFSPQKRDTSLPRFLSDEATSSTPSFLPRSTSAGNFGTILKPIQAMQLSVDSENVVSSLLEPASRSLHSAQRNQSSTNNMARQTKNAGIFRKVKGVITGHLTSGSSIVRDDSASDTHLLEDQESTLAGRHTPENTNSMLLGDVLKQTHDEQAALERSPKLQRVLGAFDMVGPTVRGRQGVRGGSPPYQRLPTIIDNSPKLQQFFGTFPMASTYPLRPNEPRGTNGSPTRRHLTMYALDSNEDLRTADDELGTKSGYDMIGLGIGEPLSRTTPPKMDIAGLRQFRLSKEVTPQTDFSGFNFFPEISDIKTPPLQFSETISGLHQHPNVMDFAEAPARVKISHEYAKRDGIALSRSPFKRIDSHQYAYNPDLYKPWGAYRSSIDAHNAAAFTGAVYFTNDVPTIKVKRTSDVSKRTSDGSKRSSTDAGLFFESPPSTKKSKSYIHEDAPMISARPMSSARATLFTSDFRFDEALLNFSPTSQDDETAGPTQTTNNLNSPIAETHDSFTGLLNSQDTLSKVPGPNRLRRMSMPLHSLSKSPINIDGKVLTVDQRTLKSGANVIAGDSIGGAGVPTTSRQSTELLPPPVFARRESSELNMGHKGLDIDDEDELQLGHGIMGNKQRY